MKAFLDYGDCNDIEGNTMVAVLDYASGRLRFDITEGDYKESETVWMKFNGNDIGTGPVIVFDYNDGNIYRYADTTSLSRHKNFDWMKALPDDV